MQFSETEKEMLGKVDKIGMQLDALPEENLIFITLSPYLDQLMALLKKLNPNEMQLLFMRYEGVMKVMRMIENEAQQMEKEMDQR